MKTNVFFAAFLFAMPAFAQVRVEAGVSAGVQPYEREEDDPRVMTGADALIQRGAGGLDVAIDYEDLSFGGHTFITHLDGVYRREVRPQWKVMLGAGFTHVEISDLSDSNTWNAEVELSRAFGRFEAFARVRQFDFKATGFRADASPSGPASYIGLRCAFR